MLNLAYHYGILYQEQHDDMLFFFREELADKRTARFFGDLLCAIFQTQYADRTYAYPTQFEPRFQISIYDVLFAFLSYVRGLTDAKHYKEVLRREFAKEKTEVEDTLPILYLLKDNTYSVTPLDACTYGYETKMVMAKWKLHGKTQARQGVRNKQRRAVYRNLMNGVSHMLPFVVGGGIMIALAFLLDDYSINPANFGMNTPVAAFFKTVGGAAFGYMLPILAGFIAMSIADRPGLAVGFAGGVLAMNGTNFTDLAAGNTTGISGGFLAALLAGFAAGYIVQFLKKITEKLPASLNGIRPMLVYPLGGILIVGAMMCAVNPVMGMINTAMTDWLNALGGSSKVLLGAIVAGMMSVDMGGPVNKAAYVFGTAALASGNYEVMAAVMVGGMVPPIAIALSTTFCPKKWTADERRNGIVNYVMGLCFVTEGAIPYAAADPLRVLPSCVAGAAVAGALSMTFGCALRAPHGGIFVFPVVDHAVLYCVALAVGSVLGAVILSLLKKNRTDAE